MHRVIRAAVLVTVVAAITVGLLGPWPRSLRLNTSASLPLGLYVLDRAHPPVRAAFVLVCPPEAAARLARAAISGVGRVPAGSSRSGRSCSRVRATW